jgi:hypothetical protein
MLLPGHGAPYRQSALERHADLNRGTFSARAGTNRKCGRTNMQLRSCTPLLAAVCACVAGCGREVAVAVSIPAPLVEALPLTVGIVYDKEFSEYVYSEKATGADWTVNLGNSTIIMMDKVLKTAFAKVVRLDALPTTDAPAAGVDFVLKPAVDEYAFLTPQDAGVDFYSVSIRFQFDAFAPNGLPVDQWQINSYGRVRSKKLNPKESLEAATDLALRDAAATMALDFKQRPQIQALLPTAGGASGS